MRIREKLRAELDKPLPDSKYTIGELGTFDPWDGVISGILGSYSSVSDDLMILALKAVRDRTTFDLIEERGFAAEFVLYVLAGHGLTEYGTSPRGGWPDFDVEDMWQELIEKWEQYATMAWQGD